MQHKTQRPVQFEITPVTRDAVLRWIKQGVVVGVEQHLVGLQQVAALPAMGELKSTIERYADRNLHHDRLTA